MASDQDAAGDGTNGAGTDRQPPVPPTIPIVNHGVDSEDSENVASDTHSRPDDANDSGSLPPSNQALFETHLTVQDTHQNARIDLQTGDITYTPYTTKNRHMDSLCDLPFLLGRQEVGFQRLLYTFLLLVSSHDWAFIVRTFNHLFHRTSDVITHNGQLVTIAPSLPPLATEESLRTMMRVQDLYPTDPEGSLDYVGELAMQHAPFIGQGRQAGVRYQLREVIWMLRGWITDAGIELVLRQ